jgi:hypothetical protein
LHSHNFVWPEYGDSGILQLLGENTLGDVLREIEAEGEAGLSNQTIEINSQ